MALRVLLADESVTIKKVIQLALQDFAVEVKAVPVGLDVLEVSKSFQPDLVFADILLQKRSGYEVCGDLKKDPTTAAIPVVLMWSSFMELDQRQVDACGADGRLEKPFEVEALRRLVLELVPRTRSQRLAHFLEYPTSTTASMKSEPAQAPPQVPLAQPVAHQAAAAKPKMPPPLASPPRAAPTSNPFGTSLGSSHKSEASKPAPPVRPPAPVDKATEPMSTGRSDFTPTPAIPDRPAPLGALPDLHLEGQPAHRDTSTSSDKGNSNSRNWNMESFEPLDLAPLSLSDDDDDADSEAFQPLKLPQAEPSPAPLSIGSTLGAALSLTDDDDDADADQWANKSLDKYRLAPLKPDESLAVDEMTPDFGVEQPIFEPPPPQLPDLAPPPRLAIRNEPLANTVPGRFELDLSASHNLTTDTTEIIPITPKKTKVRNEEPSEELPEFSLTDDDFDHTSKLEIEPVDLAEKSRPAIVRELLRDPDLSYGDETLRRERDGSATRSIKSDRFDRTISSDGVIDLSSAGKPSMGPTDVDQLEAKVREQVAPHLEKVIEKIVAQLLPQIAERIIKRELERLLEES